MKLEKISLNEKDIIIELFKSVFMQEPWNDDWSDGNQLNAYIEDLIGNKNSLALGLFEDDRLIGMSLGNIKHWYSGTEYCIDELCIATDQQGNKKGSKFIELIEHYLVEHDIHTIFLQTERSVPAYAFYQKRGFVDLADHVSFAKEF